VNVYPLYVKNRDPRVNYQPKILKGSAAQRTLRGLVELPGRSGKFLHYDSGRATLDLPYVLSPRSSRAKGEKSLAK
jgi:hypothetical protein